MDTYFENRRNALLNTLTEMETRYRGFPDEPQLPTLCATTKRLNEFAAGILNFFYTGFSSGKLHWAVTPPNNVYSILLDQIAYDMEVLQRAADQRITSGYPVMKQRLKEADSLAWEALQSAVGPDQPLEPGTTVVSYFQKSPAIRVIPYANVALIGIPYSSVDEPRDLLATPHEVGHYVFWHARDTVPPKTGEAYYLYRSLIRQAVDGLKALITLEHPDFDTWCYVWLEELFADAYGCWVAGPVSALSLQDLQQNRAVGEFAQSDGDHPAPVLRPYTALKILAANGTASDDLQLLQGNWQTILTKYKQPAAFTQQNGPNINVNDAVNPLPDIDLSKPVDRLVDMLRKQLVSLGVRAGDWRDTLYGRSGTVTDMYAHFETYRQKRPPEQSVISQPESILSGPASFEAWATTRFDLSSDLSYLVSNPAFTPAQSISEDEWLPIMRARGWTTEGPEHAWP